MIISKIFRDPNRRVACKGAFDLGIAPPSLRDLDPGIRRALITPLPMVPRYFVRDQQALRPDPQNARAGGFWRFNNDFNIFRFHFHRYRMCNRIPSEVGETGTRASREPNKPRPLAAAPVQSRHRVRSWVKQFPLTAARPV